MHTTSASIPDADNAGFIDPPLVAWPNVFLRTRVTIYLRSSDQRCPTHQRVTGDRQRVARGNRRGRAVVQKHDPSGTRLVCTPRRPLRRADRSHLPIPIADGRLRPVPPEAHAVAEDEGV